MIRGRRFWADHTPVAGQQFDYAFDDIGNRTSTLAGGDQTGGNQRSASYTRDFLNRYGSRTVPGGFDVLGVATASSAVTVNSQASYRKGEYFWKQVDVVNTSVPVWQNNTVTVSGGSTTSGNVWVPQTPEAYTYDNDGNTLTDGRWTYTWDAENRLTRLVARTATGPQQRLDFEYDHAGRRIRKTVYSDTAGTPPAATDLKFIYDGWNLIFEVDGSDASVRQYMWGTDLSGTAQGAGGVGGLVKIYDHASSKTYFPGYDGNGNVALLVDGDSGAAGAVYEYGPFGELIRSSGTYAATCPFRFSTKYRDSESDLLYYGYRYYNPSTGRWPNRDPIGERGGENMYGFLKGSPPNLVDGLGLYEIDVHYYLTYWLASKIPCLSKAEAHQIADADQGVDENPSTSPGLGVTPGQRDANRRHHVLTDPENIEEDLSRLWRNATFELEFVGPMPGPTIGWRRNCKLSALGIYLHYLQDSFSHAGFPNSVYGHAFAGHSNDKTAVNYAKSAGMAAATWKALQDWMRICRCACYKDKMLGKELFVHPFGQQLSDFLMASGGPWYREINEEELDEKRRILGILPRGDNSLPAN